MDKQQTKQDNVPQVKTVEEPKTSTNSPAGSSHWFHTLTRRSLHIGEFMLNNDELGSDLQKSWGSSLYRAAKELNEGFKFINTNHSRIAELEASNAKLRETLEPLAGAVRHLDTTSMLRTTVVNRLVKLVVAAEEALKQEVPDE